MGDVQKHSIELKHVNTHPQRAQHWQRTNDEAQVKPEGMMWHIWSQ